ncbi:mediator of RNA polymerase II transcription subunit 1 isoform X2 [Sitophilus oryzae]|uniref:Mediator of RNA polymerase II transcription subunit 1 n=1 Tax=Sitophilus oryzae TaxID=7048 RepID=A0A6J2XLT5_SITOR|nr:mediator of RNA polymerase II transcription subunit 1 isoform X2 [Sitophilus oryzae]
MLEKMNKLQYSVTTMPVSGSGKDKAKDWQLEILMEKLRSKASQFKSLPEISKNVRMTLLEKRYALDSVEKTQHQKCLDTLQHVIKVTGLQSMIERLESLTRQLGLRFVVESSGVFIFSDMFYLEIILDPTGTVKDVKIHHEGKVEQQSCLELVNCLSRGDFTDFTTQLEGFVSIYQLNAEKKVKCKAFTALESLEADLSTLAQLHTFMKDPFNLLHKSPVGILEKRRGGHPMKLTYFVSPYDLLNIEKSELDAISIDSIISKNLGYSVTVCMEGSTAHKLPTTTLITVNRSLNGKSTPTYTPLTSQNCSTVPACFTLKLNKPMPLCVSLLRKIHQIQQIPDIDNISNTPKPLLNLIVNHSSDGKMSSNNNKGLFVTLPDQTHCYCMTENKNMNGIFVSNILFTHPAQVASILTVLREQALFNTVIGSCVRPNSRQSFDNMTMFEVSALSSTQISISLEHPLEEFMATADIDLSDVSNLVCRIQNPGTPPPTNAPDIVSELATKVLNKSFSIPVTLRAVIKMWEKQATRRNLYSGQENFSLPLGSVDPGGHKGPGSGTGSGLSEYGGLQDKIKQEPGSLQGQGQTGHQGAMLQDPQGMSYESMMASNFQNFPPSDGVLTNIELTSILSGGSDKQTANKRQKRKATDDLWRSGKRKVGISDDSELIETSSCDSTSRSTPISQETEIPTPNSGSHSDLELSNIDSSEFLGSLDKTSGEPETVDMNEILSSAPLKKNVHEPSPSSTSSVVSDISEKSIVPPNVSITPITSSTSPVFTGSNTEKRPGIEIIPISQAVTSLISSSITITPITTTTKISDDKREKKSSRSSREEKEKRRKRKRDESPMGPPDKVPPKQDPLNKPVSVSIKPAESPPLSSSTPTSPNMLRKFSPSPTSSRPLSLSGKLSPNLMKPNKSSSHHSPSPKNSPAHVSSSPKHSLASISSPKHHGTSPSAGGSGKPSMSTLKSAANSNSPSSKGSSEKSKNKDSSRDKDKSRGLFNVSGSKSKSSSLKVKPLDLNICNEAVTSDGLPSPSADSKSSQNLLRNRKGSLSAIVDKLNIKVNAQHSDIPTDLSSKPSSKVPNKDGKSSGKVTGDTKNSEYMVKTSSDGMKLTINKPRTKENKSSSSSGLSSSSSSLSGSGGLVKSTVSTSSGSPKIHTGLKPGVNSGPASKKPQQVQKSSSSSSIPNSNTTAYASSGNLKTSSSSNKPSSSNSSSKIASVAGLQKTISKPTTSPKFGSTVADLNRSKDRLKQNKSSSEKSIFSSLKERGKSSPTQNDLDSIYKLPPKMMDPYTSSLMMEGMMKTLDTNFQIPKLSARTSEEKKKNELNNMNRSTVDTKLFDMVKNEIKYPIAIPPMNSLDQKIRNNMSSVLVGGSKGEDSDDKKKDITQNISVTGLNNLLNSISKLIFVHSYTMPM